MTFLLRPVFASLGLAAVFGAGLTLARAEGSSPAFALHDGDRVVFYGDSITQDGGYAAFVEEYCRSRFPALDFRFYYSGVGGDTVQGGGGGEIGLRLERDVFRHKPTVVTIMLGMNDGHYRKLEPATLAAFTEGYRSIVVKIRQAFPTARIYLIRSSPFDDVARRPDFDPGYMDVLRQMGDSVAAIAKEQQAQVVDFGTVVADALARAVKNDPNRALHLLPDRVHPSGAGHLVMGAALARALGAPPLVCRVEIDAKEAKVSVQENASVSALKVENGVVTWSEKDGSLPLPLNFEEANVQLAQIAGADLGGLDDEPLVVRGLAPGRYEVRIDGQAIGPFSQSALAEGINLALYNTPMRWQAYQVTWASESGREMQRLERQIRYRANGDAGALAASDFLLGREEADQATRSKAAVPLERHFSVTRVP